MLLLSLLSLPVLTLLPMLPDLSVLLCCLRSFVAWGCLLAPLLKPFYCVVLLKFPCQDGKCAKAAGRTRGWDGANAC
jgi:hypothetical protein